MNFFASPDNSSNNNQESPFVVTQKLERFRKEDLLVDIEEAHSLEKIREILRLSTLFGSFNEMQMYENILLKIESLMEKINTTDDVKEKFSLYTKERNDLLQSLPYASENDLQVKVKEKIVQITTISELEVFEI